MKLILVLLFCGVVSSANVERTRQNTEKQDDVVWENCMMEPIIELKELSMSPMPIEIPGQIVVNMKAQFKRPIQDLKASVNLRRKTYFGISIPIPCLNNLGSCTYRDVCNLIKGQDEFISHARQMFIAGGLQPNCPFPATNIDVKNYVLPIPPLQYSMLAYALSGQYQIETKFIEESTGIQVGCVKMEVSLGSQSTPTPSPAPEGEATTCSGWLCWG